jgi:hypothetical protein
LIDRSTLFEKATVLLETFGVIQSLADIEPDVDAIFRMTQKTPFIFDRPQQLRKSCYYCLGKHGAKRFDDDSDALISLGKVSILSLQ